MIQIYDWIRYEVNSKGQPAKDGEDLRAGALSYIRLKNHGHARNRGLQKLQKLAKSKTMEVVGIFTQFLQLAANNKAENRGVLREQKDGRPATIAELAEILPATVKQITFAVECLSNPTVSWILADKGAFPENSGDSRKSADASRTQHNTTQHNTTQHNAPEKELYLDLIFLTKAEYQKLTEKFGKLLTDELIEELNDAIGSKGYKYKSHYSTILVWRRKHLKEQSGDEDFFCVICHEPQKTTFQITKGKKVWLCPQCKGYFKKSGRTNWGGISLDKLTIIIEQGKIDKRPPQKDPELIQQDKKQKIIAGLEKG